jgi:hypothetical protein
MVLRVGGIFHSFQGHDTFHNQDRGSLNEVISNAIAVSANTTVQV